MSYCKKEGKDTIIFVTQEDHEKPSTVALSQLDEDDKPVGLVLPNGEINWSCPCLGGMATGPCGVEFRDAFSCFHNSKADPKGSDCLDPFRTMSECMSQFPGVYGDKEEDSEELLKKDELTESDSKGDSNIISKATSTEISKTS